MSSFNIKALRLDSLSLDKLLRRSVLNQTVSVIKALCALVAMTAVFLLARNAFDAFFKQREALREIQRGVEGASKSSLAATNNDQLSGKKDYSTIARQPLLGTLEQPSARPSPKASAKPISQTPLVLIGTFIERGHEPYAIIEDQKKTNQEVFNLEDSIFGEAILKKIAVDHVEIERNDQIETLVLDELTQSKAEFKGGIASVGDNHYEVEEAELDRALENLPLLLTQARAVPYFKDGAAVGLRLFAIKSDSIFEKIGLKNGDILKSVNGNSLGDITQAMKLFEMLKQERSISVKLERNSEERDYKYEIR